MEIILNLQKPNDNTNTPHGKISLKSDNRYTYIEIEGNRFAVAENDLYKAICALHK